MFALLHRCTTVRRARLPKRRGHSRKDRRATRMVLSRRTPPNFRSPPRRAAGSAHPDGRERSVTPASGRGVRMRDFHDREPRIRGLARDVTGLAGDCAGTEDGFREPHGARACGSSGDSICPRLDSDFLIARAHIFRMGSHHIAGGPHGLESNPSELEAADRESRHSLGTIAPWRPQPRRTDRRRAINRESNRLIPQTTALRPSDHARRSEFSLHIGC